METPPPPNYTPPNIHQPPRNNNTVLWIVLGVLCLCGCGAIPVMAAILFPVFAQAKEAAMKTACISNVKQQSLGVLMYANDWDDHLPTSSKWGDQTYEYVRSKQVYHCPKVALGEYGYAMSDKASRADTTKILVPATYVVLFESSDLGWNAHSPTLNFPNPSRHGKVHSTGYADGHAKLVPDDQPSP